MKCLWGKQKRKEYNQINIYLATLQHLDSCCSSLIDIGRSVLNMYIFYNICSYLSFSFTEDLLADDSGKNGQI